MCNWIEYVLCMRQAMMIIFVCYVWLGSICIMTLLFWTFRDGRTRYLVYSVQTNSHVHSQPFENDGWPMLSSTKYRLGYFYSACVWSMFKSLKEFRGLTQAFSAPRSISIVSSAFFYVLRFLYATCGVVTEPSGATFQSCHTTRSTLLYSFACMSLRSYPFLCVPASQSSPFNILLYLFLFFVPFFIELSVFVSRSIIYWSLYLDPLPFRGLFIAPSAPIIYFRKATKRPNASLVSNRDYKTAVRGSDIRLINNEGC